MKDEEYLEILLNKLRNGTMTHEELEQLGKYMERPGGEYKIKRLMDEHWKEMERKSNETDDENDPCDDPFSLN